MYTSNGSKKRQGAGQKTNMTFFVKNHFRADDNVGRPCEGRKGAHLAKCYVTGTGDACFVVVINFGNFVNSSVELSKVCRNLYKFTRKNLHFSFIFNSCSHMA